MQLYTIEQISIKESKEWSKNGKSGTYWPIGLRILGNWCNTTVWNESALERFKTLKAGDKILGRIEDNSPYGDKFVEATETDILKIELNELKQTVNNLIKLNSLKWKE